mgnify:CR=1 FL=1
MDIVNAYTPGNAKRLGDYEILRTASAVEAVKCLAEIWEQTKGWKDERNIIPSEADR